MIIFNFNPLNGHFLYPPFFPNTKAKEEKIGLIKSLFGGGGGVYPSQPGIYKSHCLLSGQLI